MSEVVHRAGGFQITGRDFQIAKCDPTARAAVPGILSLVLAALHYNHSQAGHYRHARGLKSPSGSTGRGSKCWGAV